MPKGDVRLCAVLLSAALFTRVRRNWFNLSDQMRDAGEPSIIAGITRTLIAEFDIDAERVYVAGLSAGGAMAAVMSATYPELYAATGIHSGLAYGSATDMASAFAAMRGATGPAVAAPRRLRLKSANGRIRTIVFHGASDQRVHPSNGETILSESRAGLTGPAQEMQHAGSAEGRSYTRTVITNASGVPTWNTGPSRDWDTLGLGAARKVHTQISTGPTLPGKCCGSFWRARHGLRRGNFSELPYWLDAAAEFNALLEGFALSQHRRVGSAQILLELDEEPTYC